VTHSYVSLIYCHQLTNIKVLEKYCIYQFQSTIYKHVKGYLSFKRGYSNHLFPVSTTVLSRLANVTNIMHMTFASCFCYYYPIGGTRPVFPCSQGFFPYNTLYFMHVIVMDFAGVLFLSSTQLCSINNQAI